MKLKLIVILPALCLMAVLAVGLTDERVVWRARVLVMKILGGTQDISWPELVSMLRPGSAYWLGRLADSGNPYAAIRNPYATPSDIAQGEQHFASVCAACHGSAGLGETAPSLVSGALASGDSDWALYRVVTRGIRERGMPSAGLSERDAWQVVGYVNALRQSAIQTPARGPAERRAFPRDVSAERIEGARREPENWLTYSGGLSGWRFSTLERIGSENVDSLQLAWTLQADTAETVKATPIVIDGVMYVALPPSDVLAIDARTGDQLWRYRRSVPEGISVCCGRASRGVAVLGNRVYTASLDGHLVALDTATGAVDWETQVADYADGYSLTVAPLAVRDKVIVGVSGGEFGIRGYLDAYDAATGKRAWRFYSIPEPGTYGAETWSGDAWRTGGGPTWVTGSFDPGLDLLYWGIGNPAPDFNGDARPGDNLFTNAVVALDIESGERVWHFQFTPHDEHDWDANQTPILIDQSWNGTPRRLLVTANRNGFYYVLDRVDGEFLYAAAYTRQTWASSIDSNGRPILTTAARPTLRGTLTWPGAGGGTNWWSSSYNPDTNLVYVPFVDAPQVFFRGVDDDLEPVEGELFLGSRSAFSPGQLRRTGVRALEPTTGSVVWEALGRLRDDRAWIGGVLSTAGKVVFVGQGSEFLALQARTGELLWRVNLGGRLNSNPMTYSLGETQFVAVGAGNALFAFRL